MKILKVILVLVAIWIIAAIVSFIYFLFNFSGGSSLNGLERHRIEMKKNQLESFIDSSFFNVDSSNYCISEEWSHLDTWEQNGFDFLESRIFYFSSPPKEMYYVTFIGDSASWTHDKHVVISIRAVGNSKGWQHAKSINPKDKTRIELRFKKNILDKIKN